MSANGTAIAKGMETKSQKAAREMAERAAMVEVAVGDGRTLVKKDSAAAKAAAERQRLIDVEKARLAAESVNSEAPVVDPIPAVQKTPVVQKGVTETSMALLVAYYRDAPNWSGTPLVGGNLGGSKEERGNLTQLKKAGLITTHEEEGHVWITFTEAGTAAAEAAIAAEAPKAEAVVEAAPVVEAQAPAPVKVKKPYNPEKLSGAAEAGKAPKKGQLPAGLLAYLAKKHEKSTIIAAAAGVAAPAKKAKKAKK